jgi:hypothetical protein
MRSIRTVSDQSVSRSFTSCEQLHSTPHLTVETWLKSVIPRKPRLQSSVEIPRKTSVRIGCEGACYEVKVTLDLGGVRRIDGAATIVKDLLDVHVNNG